MNTRRESAGALGVALSALALVLVPSAGGCFGHEGPRQYPEWHLPATATPAGCAMLTTWVSKSGKEGVQVALHLSAPFTASPSPSQPCRVELTGLTLALADRRFSATELPAPPTLVPGAEVFLFVPIRFDADAVWNDAELRKGALVVGVRGQADLTLPIDVTLQPSRDCEDPPPMYAVPQ